MDRAVIGSNHQPHTGVWPVAKRFELHLFSIGAPHLLRWLTAVEYFTASWRLETVRDLGGTDKQSDGGSRTRYTSRRLNISVEISWTWFTVPSLPFCTQGTIHWKNPIKYVLISHVARIKNKNKNIYIFKFKSMNSMIMKRELVSRNVHEAHSNDMKQSAHIYIYI